MAQDLFKEDILENAITQKQLERKERRESLRIKKEEQERKQAEAAAKAKKRRKIMLIAIAVLLVAGFVFGRAVYRISELKKEKAVSLIADSVVLVDELKKPEEAPAEEAKSEEAPAEDAKGEAEA